ncbi:MAG TPA: hypothetical protein VMX54_08250 [Vicinamibacteria bacterium]|nr:hypothetical protein [Vicinamibacteria bacterium]
MFGLALFALAVPASAQIIVTSIPKEEAAGAGKGVSEKKFAFHVLLAPIAKWKYGEVYINGNNGLVGTVTGTPNSDILFAGEAAFKAADDWTVGVGGWYNKVGGFTYPFVGTMSIEGLGDVGMTWDFAGDLTVYEGHANVFWRDFGLQVGVVKTTGSIGTTATFKTITLPGESPVSCSSVLSQEDCSNIKVPTFTADTTDWDLFAVYKHSWPVKYPVAVSAGAGLYSKQGVTETSHPLRDTETHTVFSGFVTGNVEVWKGLGVDVSFWYVNKTGATSTLGLQQLDNQYRFTMGVSYNFSK